MDNDNRSEEESGTEEKESNTKESGTEKSSPSGEKDDSDFRQNQGGGAVGRFSNTSGGF